MTTAPADVVTVTDVENRRVRVTVPPAAPPAPRSTEPLRGEVKVTPLLAALNAAERFAPTFRPAVPVLAGVLLTAADGVLTVTKFDYGRLFQESIPAPGMKGTGLVSGRLLLDCLRVIGRGGSVAFVGESPHAVTLTTGMQGTPLPEDGDAKPVLLGAITYRLLTMPAEDYPTIADSTKAIPVANLMVGDLAALARPLCAVGSDDTLPILTAVHVTATAGGPLEVTATDRYRLASQTIDVEAAQDVVALIDGKALGIAAAILKSEPAVEFAVAPGSPTSKVADGAWTVLRAGARTLAWRGVDGTYPGTSSIVPASFDATLDADADAFAKQVKAAAVVAERNTPVRVIQQNGSERLTIAAGGAVYEPEDTRTNASASADLLGVHVTSGDWPPFAMNPGYLLDALRQFRGKRVTVQSNGPAKPYVFTSTDLPGFKYVQMPVRLAS